MTLIRACLIIAAIAIPFLTVLFVWHYRHIRNGEWHTVRWSNKMRRLGPDGKWQVRQVNPDENDDHIHNFSI